MGGPDAAQHSLWLMPPEPLRARLQKRIAELGRELGTATFPPHVTLLGSVPGSRERILDRARRLASRLAPLEIRLLRPDGRDEPFRRLFLHVARSPALEAAHRAACEALGHTDPRPFMPHLSQVYGDLPPAERQALHGRLQDLCGLAFRAEALHVFSTEGAPACWTAQGVFPLSGTPAGHGGA